MILVYNSNSSVSYCLLKLLMHNQLRFSVKLDLALLKLMSLSISRVFFPTLQSVPIIT